MKPSFRHQWKYALHACKAPGNRLHLGFAEHIDDVLGVASSLPTQYYKVIPSCVDGSDVIKFGIGDFSRRIGISSLSSLQKDNLYERLDELGYLRLTRGIPLSDLSEYGSALHTLKAPVRILRQLYYIARLYV